MEPTDAAATLPSRGRALRALRELAGLTQTQLALKAGCSERHVRRAEADNTHVAPATVELIVGAAERIALLWSDTDPRRQDAVERCRRLREAEAAAAARETPAERTAPAPDGPRLRRRAGWMATGLFALGALGGLGAGGLLARRAAPAGGPAGFDLACPPRVRTHLASVFGRCPGCTPAHRIRVYVGAAGAFWLQGDRDAEPDPGGRWMAEARFGNQRVDNAQPLPIVFQVVAALTTAEAVAAGRLPGTPAQPQVEGSGEELERLLRSGGALAVTPLCQVERLPALDCRDAPQILRPAAPAGDAVARLRSPVELAWTPDLPMWVEVRHSSGEVPQVSGRFWPNRSRLPLPAGRYEIKVRRDRTFACSAESWVDVEESPR